MHPVVLDFVSKAVAAQVNSEIRKEIAWLKVNMEEKDKEIQRLQEQVDGLEQYGRRKTYASFPYRRLQAKIQTPSCKLWRRQPELSSPNSLLIAAIELVDQAQTEPC